MNVDIKQYDNFLTPDQCEAFIMAALPKLENYNTDYGIQLNYRAAAGYFLERKYAPSKSPQLNGFLEKINFEYANLRKKVQEISGTSEVNQEAANIVRYGKGGEYKQHTDSADTLEGDVYPQAGFRKKTCLIYLNEDFEGGETYFPKLNIKIQPRLGKAVVWNNTHEDNRVIEESLHAGLPVLSKSKWIMSIWIREKPFLKNSPP